MVITIIVIIFEFFWLKFFVPIFYSKWTAFKRKIKFQERFKHSKNYYWHNAVVVCFGYCLCLIKGKVFNEAKYFLKMIFRKPFQKRRIYRAEFGMIDFKLFLTVISKLSNYSWTCSKNMAGLWTFLWSVTFLSSHLFLLLTGKVRYFFK